MEVTMSMQHRWASVAAALLIAATALVPGGSAAQTANLALTVKGHAFQPAEIRAPANTAITLRVRNLDTVAMEFESVSLRVEKVIAGNSEGVIRLRPLGPGRYEFFDDFNQKTRGLLVIQ
jgi:hypothetical protein